MTAETVRVQVNGLNFRVAERGAGQPLVLLHGFTGSADSWQPLADVLARTHRVISIDLVGHGGSDAPAALCRYAFEDALDDLAGVSTALGIERAAWLGYSMGGRLALGLALRYPQRIRALILESSTPGIADAVARGERQTADELLARRIEHDGVAAFVAEWERQPMWQSQCTLLAQILDRQREIRLQNSAHGLANSLRSMGQGAQPSYWDRLAVFEMPVLLIAGSLDAKFSGIAAEMAASMPRSELAIVRGAGHAVHLERPQQFAELVERFLSGLDGVAAMMRKELSR